MLNNNITPMHYVFLGFLLGMLLTGCGGGSSNPSSANNNSGQQRLDDLEAIKKAPITSGTSINYKSDNDATDGVTLIIPPFAVNESSKDIKPSIKISKQMPAESPWGLSPVGGNLFDLEPSGLNFNLENTATLTLPISPGINKDNLYIGRWNEIEKNWDNLGGSVDGDFISTPIDHLSLYGIFESGQTPVRILNEVSSEEDPDNAGITLNYVSGPVPPSNLPEDKAFLMPVPIKEEAFTLKIHESKLIQLAAGQYHFTVSYPSPHATTNDLYFRIPDKDDVATGGGNSEIIIVTPVNKPALSKPLARANDSEAEVITITITDIGATSDNVIANESLVDFPGNASGDIVDMPPTLTCSASGPEGVSISNIDSSSTILPSHRVAVGPVLNTGSSTNTTITLKGTATDPEGKSIHYFWTWAGRGTLPKAEASSSGTEVEFFYHTSNDREGIYHVYLTAYDSSDQFDECQWEITVRGNKKPTIEVLSDFRIIDYGRLGFQQVADIPFTLSLDRRNLSEPEPLAFNWCSYVDTTGNGSPDTTLLKTLPILPTSENSDHIYRPVQYPGGMTCVYATVNDEDNDPLNVKFKFPRQGDIYNALTGEKIATKAQLDSYNQTLSVSITEFPMPEPLKPYAPSTHRYALPIIWEAPDNMNILDTDDDSPTHDCRHLKGVSDNVGICIDFRGFNPVEITHISANVTDGHSREQTDYEWVGYGYDDIIRLAESPGNGSSGGGSGTNKPPTCNNVHVTTEQGQPVIFTFDGNDANGDSLSYTITTQPAHGTVNDSTYIPDSVYTGSDNIGYVVNDGKADSTTCSVEITVKPEAKKYFLFKRSGVGYQRWYGTVSKHSGYDYFYVYTTPSDVGDVLERNTPKTGCSSSPQPLIFPQIWPQIWESGNIDVFVAGGFDTIEELDAYRCPVPSYVQEQNIICSTWKTLDGNFASELNSLCKKN